MLNWRTLSEDEFNRIAEVLIRRFVEEDNPGIDVKALDGRGGDRGIDLDATVERTRQLVSIYQLKLFPQGFSGEWARARKPQIQKSFDSAPPAPAGGLVPRRASEPDAEGAVICAIAGGKRHRPMMRYLGATELDALVSHAHDRPGSPSVCSGYPERARIASAGCRTS